MRVATIVMQQYWLYQWAANLPCPLADSISMIDTQWQRQLPAMRDEINVDSIFRW